MSNYPPNQGYPSQGYPPPPQGGPQQGQGERPFFPGGFNFGGVPPQEQHNHGASPGNPTQGHGGPYNPPPTQGDHHHPPNGAAPGQHIHQALPTETSPPYKTNSERAPPGKGSSPYPTGGAPYSQGPPPAQGSTHCPPGGAPHSQGPPPAQGSAHCPPGGATKTQGPPPTMAVCPPNGKPNRPAFDWVYASAGSIPPNAVQGGIEADGKPLFIARQFYQGGLHVGKVGPHLKAISLGYDGKEINLKDYYVLCGDARQLRWVECHGICNPDNWRPVEAGHESDGKPLFIAKTRYAGGEHVGKVGTHLKGGMCFGYGGKEKTTKDAYYVLAYL